MAEDLIPLVDELKAGGVIAVPTDTVYGLAAIPEIGGAIQRIFELKGRPEDKPLPILGADLDRLRGVASFPPQALDLAVRFWPGALTLVLPRAPGFEADLGGGDTDTVAVRVPDHLLTRHLLEIAGPLAVTSANRSGEAPAASASEVTGIWPDLPVLDGGPGAGEASTVVSLVGDLEVLREGAIPASEISSAL